MQVNKFMTMAVGLMVAVLLVSGLMVPVIGSLQSESQSGGVVAEEVHWYYKNVDESGTHTVTVLGPTTTEGAPVYPPESAHTGAQVFLDGELLTVLDTESPDGFILPLWVSENDANNIGFLFDSTMLWWNDGYPTIPEGSLPDEYVIIGTNSSYSWGLSYNDRVEYVIEGDEVVSAVLTTGSYTDNLILDDEPIKVKALITPDDGGDYVLCTSPIVQEDTEIILLDEFYELILRTDDTRGVYRVLGLNGKGDISTIGDSVRGSSGDWAYSPSGSEDWWWEGYFTGLSSVSVNTEETAEGIRLNSITAFANWSESDGFDVEVRRFIIPVEEGSGGSELSPTLTTLLSVIPLITVVGIIIGTIGYLRFKE